VPLTFGAGEAFQFDWSEDWAVIADERTKLQVAHFKLSHSRAFLLRAYPTFCSVEAKPIYSLYDLFVSPEVRRSGVGKVLLQAAEKLAAATGKARMDLTTARTNKPAQAVYESLGWVRDEVFYAYSKTVGA